MVRGSVHNSNPQTSSAAPFLPLVFSVFKSNKQDTGLGPKHVMSPQQCPRRRAWRPCGLCTCSAGDDSLWVEVGQEQAVDES